MHRQRRLWMCCFNPNRALWEFRLASAGTQAVLWATIGITFAVLFDRVAHRATNRETEAGLAAG